MFQETEFVTIVLVLSKAKLWRHPSNQKGPNLRTNFNQQVKTWAEFSSLDVVVFFYAIHLCLPQKTAKLKVENLGQTILRLYPVIFVKS
jgi:hypothetical protein